MTPACTRWAGADLRVPERGFACAVYAREQFGRTWERKTIMRSALFAAENMEKESQQPGMRLQNSKLLKVEMNGEMMARTGTMVADQGQMQFQALGSGGVGKW